MYKMTGISDRPVKVHLAAFTSGWRTRTFKVEVGAFGLQVTLAIVLQTAADGQLLDLTGHSVSDVVVLTAALPPPLFTHILQVRRT